MMLVTPSSLHIASITSGILPSLLGGVITVMSFVPAICAGITPISTDEGYDAFPPGTYIPALSIAWYVVPRIVPSGLLYMEFSLSCLLWNSSIFCLASMKAARTCFGVFLWPCAISFSVAVTELSLTPSNLWVYFFTASSLFSLTSFTMGTTVLIMIELKSSPNLLKSLSSSAGVKSLYLFTGTMKILLPLKLFLTFNH